MDTDSRIIQIIKALALQSFASNNLLHMYVSHGMVWYTTVWYSMVWYKLSEKLTLHYKAICITDHCHQLQYYIFTLEYYYIIQIKTIVQLYFMKLLLHFILYTGFEVMF